jgi:uncharacterized protein YndB with AHSA1/START domain
MEMLIEDVFDASPERVFDAWTDPAKLAEWYAPDGCTVRFKRLEAKTGGRIHFCISSPQFGDNWAIGEYREVTPYTKIVYTLIFADENGNPVDPKTIGMDPEMPRETVVTVTFEEENGKTRMRLRETVSLELAQKTGAYAGWLQMLNKMKGILYF